MVRISSSLLLGLLAGASVLQAAPGSAQPLREFVVTEPIHSADSIPLYIAARKGFFRNVGIDMKIVTVDAGGINSVLSGDSQGFSGGPEHIAYVKAKGGKDVRAIAGIANRANQYFRGEIARHSGRYPSARISEGQEGGDQCLWLDPLCHRPLSDHPRGT